MPKHRIELIAPDVYPINPAPYHAGPKARELEKAEIEKMLRMKVIEPAQSKVTMGIVDSICPEKGPFALILYQLKNARPRDDQGPLPNPANERVFGFPRQSAHLLNVRHRFWILENENRRLRQRQDYIHIALRTVHIFRNSVQSEERT